MDIFLKREIVVWLNPRSPARTQHPVGRQIRMGTIVTAVADAGVAVHGLVELLKDRKLITGIFFAYFQRMGFADVGFGERIAVVAAGGYTDRHGLVHLVYSNLPRKSNKVLTVNQYEFVLIKNKPF